MPSRNVGAATTAWAKGGCEMEPPHEMVHRLIVRTATRKRMAAAYQNTP